MDKKEKSGTVVIDPEADEQARRQEEVEDWAVIDRLRARNADKDPEAVLADATAAVEEVRREMYGEEQRAATSGR